MIVPPRTLRDVLNDVKGRAADGMLSAVRDTYKCVCVCVSVNGTAAGSIERWNSSLDERPFACRKREPLSSRCAHYVCVCVRTSGRAFHFYFQILFSLSASSFRSCFALCAEQDLAPPNNERLVRCGAHTTHKRRTWNITFFSFLLLLTHFPARWFLLRVGIILLRELFRTQLLARSLFNATRVYSGNGINLGFRFFFHS